MHHNFTIVDCCSLSIDFFYFVFSTMSSAQTKVDAAGHLMTLKARGWGNFKISVCELNTHNLG